MTRYLCGPDKTQKEADILAEKAGGRAVLIRRRGVSLGYLLDISSTTTLPADAMLKRWQDADAIFLPGFFRESLTSFQSAITHSLQLMENVLDEHDINDLLDSDYYRSQLSPQFELLPATYDESDPQEIAKIDADALRDGEVVADDLWLKFSWLSFDEEDTSLRCRFSFGIEGYEDVAADWPKQQLAAALTEAVFPESELISKSVPMASLLSDIIGVSDVAYVERIIYFNAPNGGAQFHQDVERGHAGVVFAQLYGSTGWLALSKKQLIREVQEILASNSALDGIAEREWESLSKAAADDKVLDALFDSKDNDALETLLNRTPEFFKQLVDKGYAYVLNPGDVILLQQQSIEHCCWHAVFCADDFPGHALSFAIREKPRQ